MDQDPTYYLWNPTLGSSRGRSANITMNITPVATEASPTGPKEFIVHLLRDISVYEGVKSWQILAYRSDYHGERTRSSEWEDRWPKNWRMSITLERSLSSLPRLRHEYTETCAVPTPESAETEGRDAIIGCMVIADFIGEAAAGKAKSEIRGSEDVERLRKEVHAPAPRFLRVDIGGVFAQLQIYLGDFPAQFFEAGAPYALAVERICEKAGGITSFDLRASKWDELFDPSGKE